MTSSCREVCGCESRGNYLLTDIEFSRWLDEVTKVVFSRTLKKTEWKNSRLADEDSAAEI